MTAAWALPVLRSSLRLAGLAHGLFEAAGNFFQRRSASGDDFRKTLELHPRDGPSQFYLERLPAWKANAPASDWLGDPARAG